MKKTLIAVAVSAATLTAFGANADTLATAQANDSNLAGTSLYNQDGNNISVKGRIEARLKTTDGKSNDASRARLGFGGTSVINDKLYGLGYFETEYTANDSDGVQDSNSTTQTVRLAYAGLGGKFGQVVYGKTNGSASQVTDFTDIMWSFGGNVSQKLEASDRPSNDLAYSGSFKDLTFKANYRFADQSGTTPASNDADGYSTSAVYNIGATGVKVGAGYENQNKSHKYTLATGYTIGNVYVGGLYTDGDLNYGPTTGATAGEQAGSDSFVAQSHFTGVEEYKAYELAASYTMGKTSFTTTYNKAKVGDQDAMNLIGVEAAYAFTSNFRTYLGYNFNLLDEGDALGDSSVGATSTVTKAEASDQAMLGLRYDF
ncbi:porin [Vibrio profundum]|uniref:porin n=1 Tax=Vibrio profundum TaxID=2910247 RepID=UPI003D14A992